MVDCGWESILSSLNLVYVMLIFGADFRGGSALNLRESADGSSKSVEQSGLTGKFGSVDKPLPV